MAGEFCSSYKDAQLSLSILIYRVSYSLNLSSGAKKCPFGERKGNAWVKIGKNTNSAPKLRMSEEFSSGHGNLHTDFISPLFQFAFGLIFSFVSFGTYLAKKQGKKAESFTLFWRFNIFRRDSGKHPSSPITKIRSWEFKKLFPHHFF